METRSNCKNFKHQNVDDDSQSEVSSDENEDPVPMEKNFKYLLRHPCSRLIVAYFSVFLCWLMFAEDPVAHSSADSRVDVVGHAYALIFTKYPHDGYSGLKVLLWVCAILSGMILGKFLFHKIILCRILRLKIFTESGQGSWVIMFLTCVVSLFLWTFIYNKIIKLEGETHKDYLVSSNMHMKFETFMKGAATLNWFGHFTTAWMVTDVMLQEREYPHWHPLTRKWWRRSKGRIIIFWFIAIGMTSVVITAITVDFINWSDMNNGFTATSEVSRCWLASFIVVLDLLIIIQDWEFPRFSTKSKVKLPGINVANPRITFCKITLEINGKWFCYGLITIMLIIDVWNWKNQFFYEPFNYGQYTNMDNVIYSVLDREFIRTANRTTLSYKYRLQDCLLNIDKKLNSKYFGESLAEKSAAFIPALLTFVLFIYYGIKLSKEDAVRKRIRKEWQKQKAKQRAAERPPEVNLNKKNIDVEDEV